MRFGIRGGFRLTTALAVSLAPLAAVPLTTSVIDSAAHPTGRAHPLPRAVATAQVSTAPLRVVLTGRSSRFAPYPVQRVEPPTVIYGRLLGGDRKIRLDGPRGGHVWTASALVEHDLPSAAMRAYKSAAASLASSDPSCRIPWTLLAGIGRVESDHGRYGGSVLGSDGVSRPAILGVPLNGVGPVAAIHDTDRGRLDHDKVWDRAVGPMQFIPSTWAYAGRDGDGDGVKSPNDINDAALAAAGYLCSGSGSLASDAGMRAAIFRYNPSDYYVALVMAFARGYRTGVFVIPSPPAPAGAAAHRKHRTKHPTDHARQHPAKAKARAKAGPATKHTARTSRTSTGTTTRSTTGGSTSGGSTRTSTTTSTPTPTPSPSPSPPALQLGLASGTLAGSGTDWTLDGQPLDLGPATRFDGNAARDYDKDGTTEPLADELAGLAASGPATFSVEQGTLVVYEIDGLPYRNADGSFVS